MNYELVPDNVSETDLKNEVNRRTSKCGYTTRLGECPYSTKIMTVVSFGQRKLNVWPRDPVTGKLIDD
jgi:hypothetical protein